MPDKSERERTEIAKAAVRKGWEQRVVDGLATLCINDTYQFWARCRALMNSTEGWNEAAKRIQVAMYTRLIDPQRRNVTKMITPLDLLMARERGQQEAQALSPAKLKEISCKVDDDGFLRPILISDNSEDDLQPGHSSNLQHRPQTGSNAMQNGPVTSMRERIIQVRNEVNQLQEEKELELLIRQRDNLQQELAQLRSCQPPRTSHAARRRSRSPISRTTQQQRARSRNPDRVVIMSTPPAAPAPASPVAAEHSMSESSSMPSDSDSESPDIKSEREDPNPTAAQQPVPGAIPAPNINPGIDAPRPPSEWCRRCLLALGKEPQLCCQPRKPGGKCIRCLNSHLRCEPVCPFSTYPFLARCLAQ